MTATNSCTNTPTKTCTNTPTNSTVANTNTPTSTETSTPKPGGCAHAPIEPFSYPNPATGSTMNIHFALCEPSSIKIFVYNTSGSLVGTDSFTGIMGSNVLSIDISKYSYGIYYFVVQGTGVSGVRKSKAYKFAVVR